MTFLATGGDSSHFKSFIAHILKLNKEAKPFKSLKMAGCPHMTRARVSWLMRGLGGGSDFRWNCSPNSTPQTDYGNTEITLLTSKNKI